MKQYMAIVHVVIILAVLFNWWGMGQAATSQLRPLSVGEKENGTGAVSTNYYSNYPQVINQLWELCNHGRRETIIEFDRGQPLHIVPGHSVVLKKGNRRQAPEALIINEQATSFNTGITSLEEMSETVNLFTLHEVGNMYWRPWNFPFSIEVIEKRNEPLLIKVRAGGRAFRTTLTHFNPPSNWRDITSSVPHEAPQLKPMLVEVLRITQDYLNSPSKERGLEERAEELAKVVAIMGIKPKDKVIEFGPGTGTMAILLARRGCFVYVYEHPSSISLEELKKNAQRFKEEIKEAGGELKIIEGDITDPRIQHTITANGHYEHWVCVDVLRPWGQQAQGLRPAPKDGIVDPGVVAQIISLMGPLVGKSIYISHPDSAWDGIYYDFPPSLITVFNSTQAFAYVQAVSHSSKSGLLLLLGRHTLSETTRPLKEEELLLGQI